MLIEFDSRIERHAREMRELALAGKGDSELYHYVHGAMEEAEHLKRFFEREMGGHLESCHGIKKQEVQNEKIHDDDSNAGSD